MSTPETPNDNVVLARGTAVGGRKYVDAAVPGTMVYAALQYVAETPGIPPLPFAPVRIFPCKPGMKEPAPRSGYKVASTNPMEAFAWWGSGDAPWPRSRFSNIGMPAGLNGLIVIDVDVKPWREPPLDGEPSLTKLEAMFGPLPPTLSQITWSGGRQLIFKGPQVKSRAMAFGSEYPGVDVKSLGGYVVVPPSIVRGTEPGAPESGQYRWVEPLLPIADLPQAWLAALRKSEREQKQVTSSPTGDGRFELSDVIKKGERRTTLNDWGCSLKRQGFDDDTVEGMLREADRTRCRPPYAGGPQAAKLEKIIEEVRRFTPVDEMIALEAEAERFRALPTEALIALLIESETVADPVVALLPLDPEPTSDYLDDIMTFMREVDPPMEMLFPQILPRGVIMLVHGDPRARKSLTAQEFTISGASWTAPFGLDRLRSVAPFPVLYIMEEDPRNLTRKRMRRLIQERTRGNPEASANLKKNLHVAVRRGISLDDPAWVERIIGDLRRLGTRLLVLDAARRLSAKTDEGPAKVREVTAVLRRIIDATGCSILIVHHDVKPPRDGQDARRRAQRASGGDWFAASECPVHVERLDRDRSLVFPQDYKFSADPDPFEFTCQMDDAVGLIRALEGYGLDPVTAERAGKRGLLLEWLGQQNAPVTRTEMKNAGLGWESVRPILEDLLRDGKVVEVPGKRKNTPGYQISVPGRIKTQDGSGRSFNEEE